MVFSFHRSLHSALTVSFFVFFSCLVLVCTRHIFSVLKKTEKGTEKAHPPPRSILYFSILRTQKDSSCQSTLSASFHTSHTQLFFSSRRIYGKMYNYRRELKNSFLDFSNISLDFFPTNIR